MSDQRIRRVQEADVSTVVSLVHELAEYERAPEECHLTARQLSLALFGPTPALFGHVAEFDGEVVGCALWFLNFSTWHGTPTIYLEDLYVRPQQRGKGLGAALFKALAQECVRRGYSRLEGVVLNWNSHAIEFYRSLGAEEMNELRVYRIADAALTQLGASETD